MTGMVISNGRTGDGFHSGILSSYQIREIASPDYIVFDPNSDPIVFEIKETDTEGHIETIENRPNTPALSFVWYRQRKNN
ncbi:MAG: hypothetical protein MSS68_02695 [Clostridiales bacterium]|nr:hypothetical protein [Clostridiales bacterium]